MFCVLEELASRKIINYYELRRRRALTVPMADTLCGYVGHGHGSIFLQPTQPDLAQQFTDAVQPNL